MQNDDKIRVYNSNIHKFKDFVEIRGVVKDPGQKELKINMTLTDLILEAGGVKNDNYRLKYEIARIDPKNLNEQEYAEILSGDWNNNYIVDNNSFVNNDIYLKPYDVVYLRPDPFFKKQEIVSISGYVYYPGEYVLNTPTLKVTDLISRAGGKNLMPIQKHLKY